MLAHDSILRHLPSRVQPETRLRFESLVFAADVLTIRILLNQRYYRALWRGYFIYFAPRPDRPLHSCVDDGRSNPHLAAADKGNHDEWADGSQPKKFFYDTYETACLMRTKMDHLTGMFQNLASRKGIHPPFFGAISYFLVEAEQMVQTPGGAIVDGGTIITVSAGSVQGDKTLIPMPNPAARPVHPPTSQFMLAAFDLELNLEEAVKVIQAILNKASEQIGEDLKRQCEAESARSGMAANDFMAEPPLGDFVLEARYKFDAPTIEASAEDVPQSKKG